MSEISSEKSELSDVAHASALLKSQISPPVGSVKDRITKAARRLKWSISRVKDIWYQDARLIKSHEMDRLKAVARVIDEQRENDETKTAISRLISRLSAIDAEFHGPEIDRLRALAHRIGSIAD